MDLRMETEHVVSYVIILGRCLGTGSVSVAPCENVVMSDTNTTNDPTDPATDATLTAALGRVEEAQRELRHDLEVLEALILRQLAA